MEEIEKLLEEKYALKDRLASLDNKIKDAYWDFFNESGAIRDIATGDYKRISEETYRIDEYQDLYCEVKIADNGIGKFKDCRPALEKYLWECWSVRFDLDEMIYREYLGAASDNIVIYPDGEVYWEHKLIASRNTTTAIEYRTTEERNALIEKAMDESGCYPCVVEQVCHNEYRAVSTIQKEAE